MRELEDLLVNRDENVPLDAALLQLASVEHPNIDVTYFVEVLDSHARELDEIAGTGLDGEDWIAATNEYLYDNLGFCGNQSDYYSPRNSCLNDVLVERKGIPITLSVVYMEIARRLDRTVRGIGLPGHFIVHYQDREFSAYIDCFHEGRILLPEECRELAARVAGVDIDAHPEAMKPVTKWQIAIRMLNNMRVAYYEKKDYERAIRVLDLYLAALPGSADEYKQRGGLHLGCRRPVEALRDFQKYLELAPRAADRAEIEGHAATLRRYVQSLN